MLRARRMWKAMMLALVGIAFHISFLPTCRAQVAGMNTLALLDQSTFGRSSALGFDYLPLFGDDPTVGFANPSLLHESMAGSAVLSVVPLFAGSTMGSLGYLHQSKHWGTFSFGFHFFGYGTFQGYDEEDRPTERFSAADYALSVGWGLWLDSAFSVGVQMKPILSQYEQYTALAVAFDVAGSYVNPARTFTATLMLRNVGAQVITLDEKVEHLPFELSAALSYKLKRAPFRLFLAVNELQRWNLRYDDPLHPTTYVDPFSGETTREGWFEGVADNALRHLQAGVELMLGPSFYARVGYNYRQGAEMRGYDALGLSAFSFGVGWRKRHFEFSYARRNYHLSQAPNYFTLTYRF